MLQTIQFNSVFDVKKRIKVVNDIDNVLITFRQSEKLGHDFDVKGESVGNLKFYPRTIHISSFGAALIPEIINEDGVTTYLSPTI